MDEKGIHAAILKWEKTFEKTMTEDERVMFIWGYTYGTTDIIEDTQKNDPVLKKLAELRETIANF